MKINISKLFPLIVISLSILAAGCTTFEVGIETIPPTTPEEVNQPASESSTPTQGEPTIQETSIPTMESQPTEAATPTETVESSFPELVTLAHQSPYASSEIGVLVLDDGEVSVQPSPVEHQVFWEYTPQSGRLAYSPEFVHGSDHNNVSVTSLWVYDYETETSEMWLEDNVVRAAWTPDGEMITAAVYNPNSEQIELVFVSGPNQVELIADCASNLFSWSPGGNQLAYVNAVSWAGVTPDCAGTYLVTFPNGSQSDAWEVERVSDFGIEKLDSGDYNDRPLWASDQNALIYPDQPFWVVPLDGSPAFIPATPNGEEPLELPRPFGGLWAPRLNQLVGYYEVGMSGRGGVWVYQLSDDLQKIEDYFRIGDTPEGENSDLVLVDWWVPGESLLVLNGDNPDNSQYLSEFWSVPGIWSLTEMEWLDYPKP